MATLRQQKLARAIVDGINQPKPPTMGKVLESTGYPKSVASHPITILRQKGTREALQDLGFTVEGADSVVKKILYKGKREETRLRAADMVYKRFGSYIDTEQGANKTLVIQIAGESARKYGRTDISQSSERSSN